MNCFYCDREIEGEPINLQDPLGIIPEGDFYYEKPTWVCEGCVVIFHVGGTDL